MPQRLSTTPLERLRRRLLWVAIATFASYYFADAAMDALVFGEGTLLEQIFSPSLHESSIRLLHLLFQSLLLWIAWLLFSEGRRLEESLSEKSKELVQTNAELVAANRQLKMFNYSLSHDLKNPLANLLTACDLLKDPNASIEEQRERLYEAIYQSGIKMNELVESMLLLAGLGTRELIRQRVDLGAQATGIAVALERQDPQRKVQWKIENDLMVEGDPQLLSIALENLLNNAYKYTAKREEAIISLGRSKENPLVIEVRDNGVGFDPQQADKLFVPFSRLHLTGEFPGHGIGLATVQNIVMRHNGEIWATSTPGEGSCFSFTLGE